MSLRDIANKKPKRKRFRRILTRKEIKRMKKGYDAERELVYKLRKVGFDALRVPISAPSREPLPDGLAIKGDAGPKILQLEVRVLACLEIK